MKRRSCTKRVLGGLWLASLMLAFLTSKGYSVPEDFDTYTTVGMVVTNAERLNATLRTSFDDYAYYDYGTGYFDDFEHQVDCLINGSSGGTTRLGNVWMLANITDDEKGIRDAVSETFLSVGIITQTGGSQWRFRLKYWNDVALSTDDMTGVSLNTMYYLTLNRTGTTIFCEIYSDLIRTNLLDNLTITVTTGVYQYVYGCNSYNAGTGRQIQVMVENLDFDPTIPDVSNPEYNLLGLNSTLNGSGIQLTINLTDDIALDHCFLEWNNSESFANVSLDISGTNQLCLFNETLHSTEGVRVEYLFHFNDSSNKWTSTERHFLYTNTEPIIIIVVPITPAQLFIGLMVLCIVIGGAAYYAIRD